MVFSLEWAEEAEIKFANLEETAKKSLENRGEIEKITDGGTLN